MRRWVTIPSKNRKIWIVPVRRRAKPYVQQKAPRPLGGMGQDERGTPWEECGTTSMLNADPQPILNEQPSKIERRASPHFVKNFLIWQTILDTADLAPMRGA